jgi:DNA-binding protein Fis
MSLRGKEVRPFIEPDAHEKLAIMAEHKDIQIAELAARLLEKMIAASKQARALEGVRVGAAEKIAHEVRRLVAEQFASQEGRRVGLYDLILGQAEKPLIESTLQRCHGNQVHAALALGINRNTLRKRMRLHGIKVGS